MTFDQSIVAQNKAELEHLIALVNRLSDAQLSHSMAADWTVSAVLAHLAFWDYRAIKLIEKWEREEIASSPIDVDIINEATRPLCLGIPPRKAVELVIACAETIDRVIAQLPPQRITQIARDGTTVHLNRADHRRNHLGEIEKTLGI